MNPFIAYDNRFNDGTPVATDTFAGYDVLNIRDLRDYTLWKAASVGTKYITIDCGSAKSADSLAILGHNFFSGGATISLESSTTGAWAGEQVTRIAGFTPTTDRAFAKTFTTASARYWRIKIVSASVIPQFAIGILGSKLLFPWPPDTPYAPFIQAINGESSRSKGGHLLGSAVYYFPITVNASFSNLDRTFVTGIFQTFWEQHGRLLKPFLWVWDNDNFPDHVFLVKLTDDSVYQLLLSIQAFADNLSLTMEGIAEL